MCEHCGCQAIASIELLTREHDQVLGHLRAAEQAARGGDLPVARRACELLRALLGPHTAVEEQALFPALDADFPEQLARLREEHRAVEAVVDVLADGGAPPDWRVRLADVATVLRRHVHHEQDGVFPAALSSLRPADWERLDAVRLRVGSGLAPAVVTAPS